MKKRVLSLALVICLCLTLLPAAVLTASADPGITVYINNEAIPLDNTAHALSNGGSAAAGVSGNKLTVTLCNAQIGSTRYDTYTEEYCGILIRAEQGQDVELILDGDCECYGAFVINCSLNDCSISIVPGTNGYGALTVHGVSILRYADDVSVGNVTLDLMADQANTPWALEINGNLTVGSYPVKGGDSSVMPYLYVNRTGGRPLGMAAYSMTVIDGNVEISGSRVGGVLQPMSVNITGFNVKGGTTTFEGNAAALLIEDYNGYDGEAYEHISGYGEQNFTPVCCTDKMRSPFEDDPNTLRYYSWGNNGVELKGISKWISYVTYDWYNADFKNTAAKSLSFGVLHPAYVYLDAGTFGSISGERYFQFYTTACERIGVLPVPTNKTFKTGTFNNMYFEGWQIRNEPGNIIDESYVIGEGVELEAVWREGQSSMPFKDVKKTDWFYNAARYCYGQGLIAGTGDGKTFSPYTNCTRAMIVSILYRMEGSPKSSGGASFTDVSKGKWYSDAVLWAAENNIVSGDGKGHFMPDANVTREQLAQIMMTYAAYNGRYSRQYSVMLVGYPDEGKISDWAGNAMAWAVGCGLISGKTNNSKTLLDPKGTATRAEFATILLNYIKAFDGSRDYYYEDLVTITIPARWVGNVKIAYRADWESMGFYASKAYKAQKGIGARMFLLSVLEPGSSAWITPGFAGVQGALLSGKDIAYEIIAYRPTDVQCEYHPSTPEGAQYFSMNGGYEELEYDSFYFRFTKGVG